MLDMFEEMVSRFRLLWLSGRYGGGKTSLAVYLAARFCQAGLTTRIVSNTPLRLKEVARLDPRDVHDVTDSVLLMDESWRYVGEGSDKQVKEWMAYMRKRNQILLMPSVMNIARALRVVRIERRFNFSGFGVPLWWYTWFLNSATGKEKQQWYWWRPARVFALYNHELPEMDDFAVYDWAAPPALEVDNDNTINIQSVAHSGHTNIGTGVADKQVDDADDRGVPGAALLRREIPLFSRFRANRAARKEFNGTASDANGHY